LIDENIVSRPVPRLFEGIMTIGKLLYPDIFTKIEKDL
jgi:iron complex transport system substrate-binding protein